MKHVKLYLLSLIVLLASCSSDDKVSEADFVLINNVELISHKAVEVKVDNFKKSVYLLMEQDQDLTSVKISLSLAPGVKMVEPANETDSYNLEANPVIRLDKNGETVEFKIIVQYTSAPIEISSADWEKQEGYGELPQYVSVYKYKKNVGSKKVKAYIAVADVSPKKGVFKVLGEKKGYNKPTDFYNNNGHPVVVMNGGYFWSGTSLGLIVKNGVTVSTIETVTTRKFNGVDTYYYPTTGAFGMDENGKFSAQWVYHSNNTLYAYPNPSPNVAGEKPQDRPSANFPSGAMVWKPKEAISAGPLLIKSGEYKNLWVNELFDEASGVGPKYNNPRSAIAFHPKGYVVFFVCEGRNKTPETPGLTLKEVADLLLDLGCTEAINLDGGGSSCMLINGYETIMPSDGKQRGVTNAVSIY